MSMVTTNLRVSSKSSRMFNASKSSLSSLLLSTDLTRKLDQCIDLQQQIKLVKNDDVDVGDLARLCLFLEERSHLRKAAITRMQSVLEANNETESQNALIKEVMSTVHKELMRLDSISMLTTMLSLNNESKLLFDTLLRRQAKTFTSKLQDMLRNLQEERSNEQVGNEQEILLISNSIKILRLLLPHKSPLWLDFKSYLEALFNCNDAKGSLVIVDEIKLNLAFCITETHLASLVNSAGRNEDDKWSNSKFLTLLKKYRGDELALMLNAILCVLDDNELLLEEDDSNESIMSFVVEETLQCIEKRSSCSSLVVQSRLLLSLFTRFKAQFRLKTDIKSLQKSFKALKHLLEEKLKGSSKHNIRNALNIYLNILDDFELNTEISDFIEYYNGIDAKSKVKYMLLHSFVTLMNNNDVMVNKLIGKEDMANLMLDLMDSDPMLGPHIINGYEAILDHFTTKKNKIKNDNDNVWLRNWLQPLIKSAEKNDEDKSKQRLIMKCVVNSEIALNFVTNDSDDSSLFMAILCLKQGKIREKRSTKSYLDELCFIRAQNSISTVVRLAAIDCLVSCRCSNEQFVESETQVLLQLIEDTVLLQRASQRQHFLALFKKICVRINEALDACRRSKSSTRTMDQFLKDLQHLLLSNIFLTANFYRINIVLRSLLLLSEQNLIRANFELAQSRSLLSIVTEDSYEEHKNWASTLLMKHSNKNDYSELISDINFGEQMSEANVGPKVSMWEDIRTLNRSVNPEHSLTSSYLVLLCHHFEQDSMENQASLIKVLEHELEGQVRMAERDLNKAALSMPMYSTILCMRRLLESELDSASFSPCLVSILARVLDTVKPLLASDAPEGVTTISNNNNNDDDNYSDKSGQALLLCCWRSCKESCLLLSDLVDVTNVVEAMSICRLLEHTLASVRHRGAFEQAFVAFSKVCKKFHQNEKLKNHLKQILKDNLSLVQSLDNEGKDEENNNNENIITKPNSMDGTRRSGGIPFLVQAILFSHSDMFDSTMRQLTLLTQNSPELIRVHACNILRSIFRSSLNKHSNSMDNHIEQGLISALLLTNSPKWMERNAATLLLSALVVRIFGVKRGQDDLDTHKNGLTTRVFFRRFPNTLNVIIDQLKEENRSNLVPILVILAKLKPAPESEDGSTESQLSKLLQIVLNLCSNKTFKVRQLAAKIVAKLMSEQQLKSFFDKASTLEGIRGENEVHGLLLVIKELQMEQHLGHLSHSWLLSNGSQILKNSGEKREWMTAVQLLDNLLNMEKAKLEEFKVIIASLRNWLDNELRNDHYERRHEPCFHQMLNKASELLVLFYNEKIDNEYSKENEDNELIIKLITSSNLDVRRGALMHLYCPSVIKSAIIREKDPECLDTLLTNALQNNYNEDFKADLGETLIKFLVKERQQDNWSKRHFAKALLILSQSQVDVDSLMAALDTLLNNQSLEEDKRDEDDEMNEEDNDWHKALAKLITNKANEVWSNPQISGRLFVFKHLLKMTFDDNEEVRDLSQNCIANLLDEFGENQSTSLLRSSKLFRNFAAFGLEALGEEGLRCLKEMKEEQKQIMSNFGIRTTKDCSVFTRVQLNEWAEPQKLLEDLDWAIKHHI